MTEFYMQKVPNMRGEHEIDVYPKMKCKGVVTLQSLADDIQNRSTFTVEDVVGVVSALKRVITERIAEGFKVKVDGLGIFSPSLVFAEGVEAETSESEIRCTGNSVRIGKIKFKADNKLIANANSRTKLHRVAEPSTGQQVVTMREERLALLLKYLQEKHYIKVNQYVLLTGLGRSKAIKELHAFSQDTNTGIGTDGSGSGLLYILK